jgi:hypothetical protein
MFSTLIPRWPIVSLLALIVLAAMLPPSIFVVSPPFRQLARVVPPEIVTFPGSIWVVLALIAAAGSALAVAAA